ncbi:MAG TPA: hypothetical protein QF804_08275 [Rhodospirillales bacterium]|jgi:hypothetical protein|nr:hypothetical protein [Rhodospirillales bacterium]HJO69663.1 hypothetical protein [Rhodospirillales bacterium]
MIIKRRRRSDVRTSEITPKDVYMERRRFIAAGAGALLFGAAGVTPTAAARAKLDGVVQGLYQTDEKWTPYDDVTSYNNFYEFGTLEVDRHGGLGFVRDLDALDLGVGKGDVSAQAMAHHHVLKLGRREHQFTDLDRHRFPFRNPFPAPASRADRD